jgi:hypothetical protein
VNRIMIARWAWWTACRSSRIGNHARRRVILKEGDVRQRARSKLAYGQ